jgi:Fe-Mn family superoxide dismutase
MAFTLPPLPYDKTALAPHISAETLEFHHGKHHQAYVTQLNKLLEGKPEADKSLEDIIQSSEGPVFNNAAQIWNHTFYWHSMKPNGGGQPTGDLAAAITRDFGSFGELKTAFNKAGLGQFGSGWAVVLVDGGGKLSLGARANQDSPLIEGKRVLFGNDVWEHAYYLKYQNRRADYLAAWWNVVNWPVVAARYKAASEATLGL